MKKVILLSFMFLFLFSFQKIEFENYISKVAFDNKYLVSGLENGEIIIKDFKTLKKIDSIKLPMIKDFMDENIPMPIYSLDILGNKLLILGGGEDNRREVFIFNLVSKKLTKLFETKDTLMKGKFLDKNRVIFGLLSDEIIIYNLKSKKNEFKKQIGNYVFSTFVKNGDKIAIGDESGVLKIFNLKTHKITNISGFNKDKTISVGFRKNLVLNASSDMRIAVYNLKGDIRFSMKGKFLPYGADLSEKGDKLAFQIDDKNSIAVYNLNKKLLKTLKGHKMPLNGLKFIGEDKILSFSPNEIIIWSIK
jgi:WD40 repeat protein